MKRIIVMLVLTALMVVAAVWGSAASFAAITCPEGYERQGNRCVGTQGAEGSQSTFEIKVWDGKTTKTHT